jgi:hypothetical protein
MNAMNHAGWKEKGEGMGCERNTDERWREQRWTGILENVSWASGCSRIHTVVGEYWGEVVARITGMRHVLEEGKLGDCAVSRKLNQFQL